MRHGTADDAIDRVHHRGVPVLRDSPGAYLRSDLPDTGTRGVVYSDRITQRFQSMTSLQATPRQLRCMALRRRSPDAGRGRLLLSPCRRSAPPSARHLRPTLYFRPTMAFVPVTPARVAASPQLLPHSVTRFPITLPSATPCRPGRARRVAPRPVPAMSVSSLESLALSPIPRLSGAIDLPGSKSLSNRVLLLAALSSGRTTVRNLLDSDDIRYMKDALTALGVHHELADETTLIVDGCAGVFPTNTADLFLGNAGTAMRPLSAALCTPRATGAFVLDGTPRMRERPIVDLVDALRQLGADVSCSDTGCPPVRIATSPAGLPGGSASVSGKISSQYLSALLMAAPLASSDVELFIKDELVSLPYVKMTLNLMCRFGVTVKVTDKFGRFSVPAGQVYKSPGEMFVEGDASSASYFMAGAAISGGKMTVRGCGSESVQGDVEFARVLEQMGARVEWEANAITVSRDPGVTLKGVDVDCGDIPDAAMSLATTALFAQGKTAIRNVYNWRVKETERMHAIVTELRKLGANVEEGRDYCVIEPPAEVKRDVPIDTYDDHRMAMAFSLVACGGVPVVIRDPGCTAKTFPTYFDELSRLSVDE